MRNKNVIILAVVTLVTALGWVFFDVYHAYITTTITPALEKIAVPLTPKIEAKVFEKLKSRKEPTILIPLEVATTSAIKR